MSEEKKPLTDTAIDVWAEDMRAEGK